MGPFDLESFLHVLGFVVFFPAWYLFSKFRAGGGVWDDRLPALPAANRPRRAFYAMLRERVVAYQGDRTQDQTPTQAVLRTTYGRVVMTLEHQGDVAQLRVEHPLPELPEWFGIRALSDAQDRWLFSVGSAHVECTSAQISGLWRGDCPTYKGGIKDVVFSANLCHMTLHQLTASSLVDALAPQVIDALNWVHRVMQALPDELIDGLLACVYAFEDQDARDELGRKIEELVREDDCALGVVQEALHTASVTQVLALLSLSSTSPSLEQLMQNTTWTLARRMSLIHTFRASTQAGALLTHDVTSSTHTMPNASPLMLEVLNSLTLQDALGPLGVASPGCLFPLVMRQWFDVTQARDTLISRVEYGVDQMPTHDIFAWLRVLSSHNTSPLLSLERLRGMRGEELDASSQQAVIGWMLAHVKQDPSCLGQEQWLDVVMPWSVWMQDEDLSEWGEVLSHYAHPYVLSLINAIKAKASEEIAEVLERAHDAIHARSALTGGLSLTSDAPSGGLSVHDCMKKGGVSIAPPQD